MVGGHDTRNASIISVILHEKPAGKKVKEISTGQCNTGLLIQFSINAIILRTAIFLGPLTTGICWWLVGQALDLEKVVMVMVRELFSFGA